MRKRISVDSSSNYHSIEVETWTKTDKPRSPLALDMRFIQRFMPVASYCPQYYALGDGSWHFLPFNDPRIDEYQDANIRSLLKFIKERKRTYKRRFKMHEQHFCAPQKVEQLILKSA